MELALAIAAGVVTVIWVALRVLGAVADLATIPAIIDGCRKHFLVPPAWVVFIGAFVMAFCAYDGLHSILLTVLFAILSCAVAVAAIFLPDTIAARFRRSRTR